MHDRQPDQSDYERLLEFRTSLRRFLHWSEQQARAQNLTPAQHQLLLAVRGHPGDAGPSIGEVADYLLLKPNSAVELVDRAQRAGLVTRVRDPNHHSIVRLTLTADGDRRLRTLSAVHLEEVPRLARTMRALFITDDGLSGPPDLVATNEKSPSSGLF